MVSCNGSIAYLKLYTGTSLAVQSALSLHGGMGSNPGWGSKILHAARCGQNNSKELESHKVSISKYQFGGNMNSEETVKNDTMRK